MPVFIRSASTVHRLPARGRMTTRRLVLQLDGRQQATAGLSRTYAGSEGTRQKQALDFASPRRVGAKGAVRAQRGCRVHRIEDSFTNWYLLEDAGRLTVVDTGVPSSWESLHAVLPRLGRAASDIEATKQKATPTQTWGRKGRVRRTGVVAADRRRAPSALGVIKQERKQMTARRQRTGTRHRRSRTQPRPLRTERLPHASQAQGHLRWS